MEQIRMLPLVMTLGCTSDGGEEMPEEQTTPEKAAASRSFSHARQDWSAAKLSMVSSIPDVLIEPFKPHE